MTISVVLATFNEEKNLEECLKSVKELADEICVVDGTSTDRTVEISKRFGARIIVRENPQMFHINKQKAIDMANKDWILQLDADERVTPELEKEIREAIEDKNYNGYWIPRKNWFLGRFLMKGGQYPDYTLRLYRKGKGHLPQKDVHEQAVVEGKVGYLKNPLVHIADPEFKRYLMRWNRYTDIMASDIIKEGKQKDPIFALKNLFILPSWWFVLTYFRHKGFMDFWQGFLFSFFSSIRFPASYKKSWISKK